MICKSNIIKDTFGKIKIVSDKSKYFGESKLCGGMVKVEIIYKDDYGRYGCNCCSPKEQEYRLVCAKCKKVYRTFGVYEIMEILQGLVDDDRLGV